MGNRHGQDHSIHRSCISHESSLDFDCVLSNIHARIGDMTINRFDALTAEASTGEALERTVETCLGPSGFMLFATIDMEHGFRSLAFPGEFFVLFSATR